MCSYDKENRVIILKFMYSMYNNRYLRFLIYVGMKQNFIDSIEDGYIFISM